MRIEFVIEAGRCADTCKKSFQRILCAITCILLVFETEWPWTWSAKLSTGATILSFDRMPAVAFTQYIKRSNDS